MEPIRQWWVEERIKRVIRNLENHDFKALFVKDREEAKKEIRGHLSPGMKIGVGGSITLREMGVVEMLEKEGYHLYDHWKAGLSKEEVFAARKSQMTSDLFLASANAITLNGEIVNIDGIGNRVSSTIFGPGKVILVAGYNKIVENVEEAIRRVKNIATPLNARRLNLDLPCAKTGKCVDCNSPNRICRVIVIHERKPSLTDMLVILVGEELGY